MHNGPTNNFLNCFLPPKINNLVELQKKGVVTKFFFQMKVNLIAGIPSTIYIGLLKKQCFTALFVGKLPRYYFYYTASEKFKRII